MEDWQVEFLESNKEDLTELITCSTMLLAHLKSCKILSPGEDSDLRATSSEYRRSELLLDLLIKNRKPNSYEILLEALKSNKQTGAAKILENGNVQHSKNPSDSATIQVTNPPPSTDASPTSQTDVLRELEKTEQDDATQGEGGNDTIDFMVNVNPLHVSVKPPPGPMNFADDFYRLPESMKGYALVINITQFVDSRRNRKGATNDSKYMEQLWTQLGYKVTVIEGRVTLHEIGEILEDFKGNFNSTREPVSCVVFIGSHGLYSEIETSDLRRINLFKNIIYRFDNQRCPELNGMPKLFLIQACQQFSRNATDSIPNRTEADQLLEAPIDHTMVCFSTIPGYISNRDLHLGTWFTYCLSKAFMENAYHMDLYKLLKKTQEIMRNIDGSADAGQLCTMWDFGIRTMYFNMHPENS